MANHLTRDSREEYNENWKSTGLSTDSRTQESVALRSMSRRFMPGWHYPVRGAGPTFNENTSEKIKREARSKPYFSFFDVFYICLDKLSSLLQPNGVPL